MIDFMSNRKYKKLIHDVNDLFQFRIEKIADPTSIIAITEVIAHLSYTSEMKNKTALSYRKHIHSTHRQKHHRPIYNNNETEQEGEFLTLGNKGKTTPDSTNNYLNITNARSIESQKRYKPNSQKKLKYQDKLFFAVLTKHLYHRYLHFYFIFPM